MLEVGIDMKNILDRCLKKTKEKKVTVGFYVPESMKTEFKNLKQLAELKGYDISQEKMLREVFDKLAVELEEAKDYGGR